MPSPIRPNSDLHNINFRNHLLRHSGMVSEIREVRAQLCSLLESSPGHDQVGRQYGLPDAQKLLCELPSWAPFYRMQKVMHLLCVHTNLLQEVLTGDNFTVDGQQLIQDSRQASSLLVLHRNLYMKGPKSQKNETTSVFKLIFGQAGGGRRRRKAASNWLRGDRQTHIAVFNF